MLTEPRIILASQSKYRAEQLQKLNYPFEQIASECDESPHAAETVLSLVERLAEKKAQFIAEKLNLKNCEQEWVVIGSDQAIALDHHILGKPGSHEIAKQQLLTCSGRVLRVYTSLCVLSKKSPYRQIDVIVTDVIMRTLSEATIEHYLQLEKPYDCAGAIKSEGLGIGLIAGIYGQDPAGLIGLPLIRLTDFLLALEYQVPG
ncbi:MAG: Maf family protein [Pseudomonadota bacterium]